MEERMFHVLMRELCEEEGISLTKLSHDWILQLKKGESIQYITGNRWNLNGEATGDIACDKYATYEVLKSQNVQVIEHNMIFNPSTRSRYIPEEGNWGWIINYVNNHPEGVVLKPNYGCEGQGVYLCRNICEVEKALAKLFRTEPSVSICPYYNIKMEYRTFFIEGDCPLVYGKIKPYVVGDGSSTLDSLIGNMAYELPQSAVMHENLKLLDQSYVPEKGEKIELSWKHNLSGGATPTILADGELKTDIINLARKVAKAMNIKYATIDIISTEDDKLYVMEVNSGVCMTKFIELVDGGYEIAKEIYRKALRQLF